MSTAMDNDDCERNDSESVWPTLLLASSSLLLGYLMGRLSVRRDLREAARLTDESPDPVHVVLRTM
ncbi:MAG TPA: hypothetical protein VFT22_36395 [Kofleriaceae bacterium]|nr:hypothetical protein [Kofleriaceae bacterium]